MKPSLVLTNDEKKIRFRNFLKKKGDQEKISTQSGVEVIQQVPREPSRSQNEIPANQTPVRQQTLSRRAPYGVESPQIKSPLVTKRNTGEYTHPLSKNYPGLFSQHPLQPSMHVGRDEGRPEPARVLINNTRTEIINQDRAVFKAPKITARQSYTGHPYQRPQNVTGQAGKRLTNQQQTHTVHSPGKTTDHSYTHNQDLARYYRSSADSKHTHTHNRALNEFERKLMREKERYLNNIERNAESKYASKNLEINPYEAKKFVKESNCVNGSSGSQSSSNQLNGEKPQNSNTESRYQNTDPRKQGKVYSSYSNASSHSNVSNELENKWVLSKGDKDIFMLNVHVATNNLQTTNTSQTKAECRQEQGTKNCNRWLLTDGPKLGLNNSPSSLSRDSISPELEVEDLRTSIFENGMAENKWLITVPKRDVQVKNVMKDKLCLDVPEIDSEPEVLLQHHQFSGKKYRVHPYQKPQVNGASDVNKWLLTKGKNDLSKSAQKNPEEIYQISVNEADVKAEGHFAYLGNQDKPWYFNKRQRYVVVFLFYLVLHIDI